MDLFLSGVQFVVDGDLVSLGHMKLDSAGRSVITILRHCGRIREIRTGKLIRYACTY